MGEINSSEKRDLLSFLESYYDIPREELYKFVDKDSFPENPRELDFVKDKMIYSKDEVVGSFSAEFRSRVEYLDEFIRLNLDNPPSFKKGYVYQVELSDQERMKARDNPRLTTKSLLGDGHYDNLISSIQTQVNFLESEIENCDFNEDVENQLNLTIALMKYSLADESSAKIKNSFRPLSYISAYKNLSQGRHSHAYAKIGHKLDFMFENTDTIPEKLLPHFQNNIKPLVSTIDRSVEAHQENT